MNPNLKQIAVSKQNYALLKQLGQAGDSLNDVLTRLLRNMTVTASTQKPEDDN
jgi:predicted CopG family antitoxin